MNVHSLLEDLEDECSFSSRRPRGWNVDSLLEDLEDKRSFSSREPRGWIVIPFSRTSRMNSHSHRVHGVQIHRVSPWSMAQRLDRFEDEYPMIGTRLQKGEGVEGYSLTHPCSIFCTRTATASRTLLMNKRNSHCLSRSRSEERREERRGEKYDLWSFIIHHHLKVFQYKSCLLQCIHGTIVLNKISVMSPSTGYTIQDRWPSCLNDGYTIQDRWPSCLNDGYTIQDPIAFMSQRPNMNFRIGLIVWMSKAAAMSVIKRYSRFRRRSSSLSNW